MTNLGKFDSIISHVNIFCCQRRINFLSGSKTEDVSQQIPAAIWNLLPKKADYIRRILDFCGYETVDSIVTLTDEEEQTKMFKFIVSMKDCVDDFELTFGPFCKAPEMVTILPGLKSVFNSFIQAVVKYKASKLPPADSPLTSTPKVKPKRQARKQSKENNTVPPPSLDDTIYQMRQWLEKNEFDVKFVLKETINKSTFDYYCSTCRWKTHLTVNDNNKISLSNVYRHYKSQRCKKMTEKMNSTTLTSSTITNFFSKENNQKPPTDPNRVDFMTSNTSSSTSNDSQSQQSSVSKNSLPPTGTLENTDTSGRQ